MALIIAHLASILFVVVLSIKFDKDFKKMIKETKDNKKVAVVIALLSPLAYFSGMSFLPILIVGVSLLVAYPKKKKESKELQIKKLLLLESIANADDIDVEFTPENDIKEIKIEIRANMDEQNLVSTLMKIRRVFPKQEFTYELDYEGLSAIIKAIQPLPKIVVLDNAKNIHNDVIDLAVSETLQPVKWDPNVVPHLFIGGVTGGGKSSMINSILYQMLSRPDKWELILADMKATEFGVYDNPKRFPNVITVATNPKDFEELILDAVDIMAMRQEELRLLTAQDGKVHNNYIKTFPNKKRLIIIVDEVYDAFIESKKAKAACAKIGRLGRALAVHLILATQRPDAKVMGGNLMSNLPGRVCAGPVKTFQQSLMILGDTRGRLIPAEPKGRCLISWHNNTTQGLYTPDSKMDELDMEGKMKLPNTVLPTSLDEDDGIDSDLVEDHKESKKKNSLEDLLGL